MQYQRMANLSTAVMQCGLVRLAGQCDASHDVDSTRQVALNTSVDVCVVCEPKYRALISFYHNLSPVRLPCGHQFAQRILTTTMSCEQDCFRSKQMIDSVTSAQSLWNDELCDRVERSNAVVIGIICGLLCGPVLFYGAACLTRRVVRRRASDSAESNS
jgi:hypothetical protein